MTVAIGGFLTTIDVAVRLGVTEARVRQLHSEKRLEGQKIGTGLFFDEDVVEEFAKIPRKTGRPKNSEKSSPTPIAKSLRRR